MTQAEFEEQRAGLQCQGCGHIGLVADHNVNNNGVRPKCPACGSIFPIAGVQWMPKAALRKPKRGKVDTRSVWQENGDHCSFCGKTWDLCERLRIQRQAQHVVPFAEAGDEWPLIPICARCHQAASAAQEETKRILREMSTLDETIKRIEASVAPCDRCGVLIHKDHLDQHRAEAHP